MPEQATIDDVPSISEMASQVNEAAAKGEAAPAPQETATKSASELMGKKTTVEAPKPEAKAAEAKETPKTADKAADKTDVEKPVDWKTAPNHFRKSFEKTQAELKAERESKTQIQSKVAEYEARIKEIESKPVETKADTALVEKYESEIKQLRSTVQELDYSKSAEFQDKFVKPLAKTYQKALQEVQQLTVTDEDRNSRAATQQDFDTLRSLPFGQRRAEARKMFGADADVVLSHISRIEQMRQEGNEALEEAKTNGDLRQKEQRISQQREQEQYQNYLKQAHTELETEFPDFFKPSSEDPDAAKALQSGYELVDAAVNKAGSMTLKDRAAYNAVFRARAAAFPLMEHNLKKIAAERDGLVEELKKYRGSDPGAGGEKAQANAPVEDDVPDFKTAIAKFNE